MAVEGDLEADDADLAVQRITLALVDPGVGHVGDDFALEVVVHGFTQGHVLVVPQAGVRLGLALGCADIRLGVALAEAVQ